MLNRNWFLLLSKKIGNFSFCICKLAITFYVINKVFCIKSLSSLFVLTAVILIKWPEYAQYTTGGATYVRSVLGSLCRDCPQNRRSHLCEKCSWQPLQGLPEKTGGATYVRSVLGSLWRDCPKKQEEPLMWEVFLAAFTGTAPKNRRSHLCEKCSWQPLQGLPQKTGGATYVRSVLGSLCREGENKPGTRCGESSTKCQPGPGLKTTSNINTSMHGGTIFKVRGGGARFLK